MSIDNHDGHDCQAILPIIIVYAIMLSMTKKPVAPTTKPLQVKMAPELLEKLDDLRRGRLTFPTRSDIVRELIEKAHAMKFK